MPELVIPVIPGLRHTENGPSEKQHAELRAQRENGVVKLWAHSGTELECEESWKDFLLEGALGCRILNYEEES